MEVDEDLERSLLASEVLNLSAARARRAGELVAEARQTAAEAEAEGGHPYLTGAADSMAADALHLAEESEELTRMAAEFKASLEFARSQNPGLLGRIAAFCSMRSCSVSSSSTQGDTSSMHPLGLSLSLGLFPYMGRQGILSSQENFSNNDLWWIDMIFTSWWCLVSFGVAASLCPETRLQIEFVRLSRHVSLLGITILVILYGYVMLAPQAWIAVLIFLAMSCFFHAMFYLQSWRRM